ncbi:MAG: hypothetical protein M1835_005496 [Candelina submexicana]|nr:MAG: hypothetical protein M1835_005496 [Candelina submexicana]
MSSSPPLSAPSLTEGDTQTETDESLISFDNHHMGDYEMLPTYRIPSPSSEYGSDDGDEDQNDEETLNSMIMRWISPILHPDEQDLPSEQDAADGEDNESNFSEGSSEDDSTMEDSASAEDEGGSDRHWTRAEDAIIAEIYNEYVTGKLWFRWSRLHDKVIRDGRVTCTMQELADRIDYLGDVRQRAARFP